MDIGIVKEKIDDGKGIITIISKGECETCNIRGACSIQETEKRDIEVFFDGEIETGDRVEVYFSSKFRVLLSLFLFLLPVVFVFVAYYLLFLVTASEGLSIIFSFIGFFFSFFIIYIITRTNKNFKKYTPVARKTKSDIGDL